MANGDDAAAAGLATVAGTNDRRLGYDEINKSRDYIARHFTGAAYKHAISHITGLATAMADAATITTGTLTRPVNTSGSVDAAGSLKSGFANSYDILTSRKAVWMDASGVLGYASSSRFKKQDIVLADLTIDQLRAVAVCFYRYIAEVEKERTGYEVVRVPETDDDGESIQGERRKLPEGYRAATEIGVIAEDLDALGLWMFVIYEGRGETAVPVGVHYELLGLAALRLAQMAWDEIDSLASRLDKLEKAAG